MNCKWWVFNFQVSLPESITKQNMLHMTGGALLGFEVSLFGLQSLLLSRKKTWLLDFKWFRVFDAAHVVDDELMIRNLPRIDHSSCFSKMCFKQMVPTFFPKRQPLTKGSSSLLPYAWKCVKNKGSSWSDLNVETHPVTSLTLNVETHPVTNELSFQLDLSN